jgi:hypothetical protein
MPTLDEIAERMVRVEDAVVELRSELTDERVQLAGVVARVDAHEQRGQERHVEIMAAMGSMRADWRATLDQLAARDQHRADVFGRVAIALIGLGSTIAAGYYGLT